MDKILTANMIAVALLVAALGKFLKETIFSKVTETTRKWLLPLALIIIGVALMELIEVLNHTTNYGNALVNGLISSVFCQFIYDKYHDLKK